MTEDLWGPTVLCADCKAEIRWGALDTHWCLEAEQQLNLEIAALEGRLSLLRARRDLKRAARPSSSQETT